MLGELPIRDGRGTEYMSTNVAKRFFTKLNNLKKYNWVVLPGANEEDEKNARIFPTIVWMHVPSLYAPDFITKYFKDKTITENVKAYIVQSEFHKKDIVTNFKVPEEKVVVLNNAFDPIDYEPKPKRHVNLIYVSQQSRGLDILLEAFSKVNDPNISLVVHGCSCQECMEGVRVFPDNRVRFVGHTSKQKYRENMQRANLLIYPCRFEETAGIAIMEALSAGIKIVSTDLGALPETTLGFAKLIKGFPRELDKQNKVRKRYVRIFAKEIRRSIKQVRKEKFDPIPQIEAVKQAYSWEAIEKQWQAFNDQM